MSRSKLGDTETVSRTIKLPVELDRRLRARALVAVVPMSLIVRSAILEYLRKVEK